MAVISIIISIIAIAPDFAVDFIDDIIADISVLIITEELEIEALARAAKLEKDRIMKHRKNYTKSNTYHKAKKIYFAKGEFRQHKEKGVKNPGNVNALVWGVLS